DRKRQMAVAFVGLRCTRDVNLATIGECDPDVHLVEPTIAMMFAGPFDDDPAGCDPTVPLFQLSDVLLDHLTRGRADIGALKINLYRGLHDVHTRLMFLKR